MPPDLRYALRSLHSHFGFSLIAISIVALAIGASGSMFSVLNSVVPPDLHWNCAGKPADLLQCDGQGCVRQVDGMLYNRGSALAQMADHAPADAFFGIAACSREWLRSGPG